MAKNKNIWIYLVLIVAVLFFLNKSSRQGTAVIRANYDCSVASGGTVTFTYVHADWVQGEDWAIEEVLPLGWTELSGKAVLDPDTDRYVIREFTSDTDSITLKYVAPIPGGQVTEQYIFDSGYGYKYPDAAFSPLNPVYIEVKGCHWADSNCDLNIDAAEFASVLNDWKNLQLTNSDFVDVIFEWKLGPVSTCS